MQQVLRPHATAGIALVGAGLIAATPVITPLSAGPVARAAQLTAVSYGDVFSAADTNLNTIFGAMDSSAVNQVFSDLSTNPAGVIGALSDLTPTVTSDLTSFPATVSVEMPSGLALAVGLFGAVLAGLSAANQAAADPSTFATDGLPAILNGFLNGQENVSLLGGIINIPLLNGVLSTTSSPAEIDLNLGKLLDTLGLGNLPLTSLVGNDLSGLADDLKSLLGGVQGTLGGLLGNLGLTGESLSTLLGGGLNGLTLSGLLGDLGLGNLSLGGASLTNLLGDLGLSSSTNLNSLPLDSVLTALGINPNVDIGLSGLLTNLGFGSLLNEGLGSLIPSNLLTGILGSLNGFLGGILGDLTGTNLTTALNTVTLGDLLGGQTVSESLAKLLTDLGVSGSSSSGLTLGSLLTALGVPSTITNLNLGDLLNDLGGGNLPVGDLLGNLNLGDLLNALDLNNLPLNLGNLNLDDLSGILSNLSNLNLGDLLGDLGLDKLDLANISVGPFTGFLTELVDDVPQQILAALGSSTG